MQDAPYMAIYTWHACTPRSLSCTIKLTSGSVATQAFIKAVRSFNLKKAFPNMESHPYDWRVDKYEPHRVWFTVRNTATHTGPLTFAGSTYKPTGKVRPWPPAACMAAHDHSMMQLLMGCSPSLCRWCWARQSACRTLSTRMAR